MTNSVRESPCLYLFGKEPGDLFNSSVFSSNFVNKCLDTLMKVNILFLSKGEDACYPLLSPAAFNNQCHVYSLITAKLVQGYVEKSEEEKSAQTEDNRFLHLSFFLSFTFLTERPLLLQVIKKASEKENLELPQPLKTFDLFLKDHGGNFIHASRLALNSAFEKYIKDTFQKNAARSLLHRELYQLCLEDLHLEANKHGMTLYTLPKLAGVAFVINENVPLVIKTKVITKEGNGTLFYKTPGIDDTKPVLVFESIASDDLSIEDFRRLAGRCNHYSERNVSRKRRHNEEECRFCTKNEIDVSPFQERFNIATSSLSASLYALGADFMQNLQRSFIPFFEDTEKYPTLSDIYKNAVSLIEPMGLSMQKPLSFTVEHVHLDSAKHALSRDFRMNSSPESFLKERGLL